MFENPIVKLDEIPKSEEVSFVPLHHDYGKIIKFNSAVTFILGITVAAVLFFSIEETEKIYGIAAVLLLTAFLGLFPLLSYRRKKYAFRLHDVLFKKGLFYKSVHISPYIRLQHVIIKQSWLAKRFGLATLSLYTAANSHSDISIPGLTLEEAERWKSFLLNRLQNLEDESESL